MNKETEIRHSGTTGVPGSIPAGDPNRLPRNGDRNNLTEEPCFVVGIGASSGGQEPLEHIFTTLPADCDIAYVVVMHLPPDGPSLLADLLRRYTPMDVLTAEDGSVFLPNTVHVPPPGACLSLNNGRILVERGGDRAPGADHPIDRFFTALAGAWGERAIAVVLSGCGADGAEGVRRIRESGGTVLVQDPESALNPSMPGNVVATGFADLVLNMEEIPAKITEIARGRCGLHRHASLPSNIDEELNSIFAVVRAGTGHDFSSYKRSTVMRRIERRMTANESGGLRKYLALLERNPEEVRTLAQEILIGVTGFFRDPDAFEVILREVLPNLFAGRDPEDPVRIWHACCATGEEAYSVAMMVREYLDRERLNIRVKIFATDIDEAAVAQGRSGLYPEDIADDVGEERLETFFTRSAGRWQAVKELRQMILFACHNIIRDPPFSRLDLMVCRNFLIYLNPDIQKRLVSLFHLVLKPGGFLFLGTSETPGHNSELFSPVDKKWKIFQRMEGPRREDTLFHLTTPVRKVFSRTAGRQPSPEEPAPWAAAQRLLVERYSPPCVVVNENYEVLHISSSTRSYLEVPVGAPSMDILKMAREEIRPALRTAIYKSFSEEGRVVFRGVKATGEEDGTTVNVTVEPLAAHPSYGKLALVTLEPVPAPAVRTPSGSEKFPWDGFSRDAMIRQLEEQLRIANEQLRFTTEQLEASNEGLMATNEELMSINEEFQSANEELQSTNEELEASKEELQALNEELATVNAELHGKVEELDQTNGDMENLFASSGIPAVFLDRNLTIKRFSPAMASILNLIPADIGRPFRHLSGTIDWSGLPMDARSVLEKLSPVEREAVSLDDGRCFIMRVLPYLTGEGNVNGIVVTLVDITELKRAEDEIRSAALFPLENPSPVLRISRDGTLFFSNRASEPLLSLWRTECGTKIPDKLLGNIASALDDGVLREYDFDMGDRCISFSVVPFPARHYANIYGRDVTQRKRAEEEARSARDEWERTFESVPDLIAILDNKHRITRVNRAMAQRLGLNADECIGLHCYRIVHGTDRPTAFCPHSLTMKDGLEHMMELREDHLGGDFLVSTTPLMDGLGKMIGAVHMARDISERKTAEAEILRHVEELERFNGVSVGRELRMIELKKEVNELRARLGEPPRYPLDFAEE